MRRKMKTQNAKGDLVKNVAMTVEDAAQVQAILMTHSMMQDNRVMQTTELLARLKKDTPGEVDMIADLQDQIESFEEDSDNLQRIAQFFN